MRTCKKDEFKCKDSSGRCVQNSWVCDQMSDCDDSSDEDIKMCKV